MREKWLTLGVVYTLRDFPQGHNQTNIWPRSNFFSLIYSSNDKLWLFYDFLKLSVSIVQEKKRENYYKFAICFTDTRKQFWKSENMYESAVAITSPLKTI